LRTTSLLEVPGVKETRPVEGWGHPVEQLPDDTLIFLMGSRYCETDLMVETAWQMFGQYAAGRETVQAICDFVHQHIEFDYGQARPTKTAWDAYRERKGVCRDFAHLAVTLCRAMNIPARYCTGYISDVGVPPNPAPMDFAAWFEAYVGGSWQTFDPRNNEPRIGRVLLAYGRDAADVPLSNAFGAALLTHFEVHCAEE
jgi:transglutaminase-like putative cysteine protease